uniref:Uncharacterized protein n=1 Tax=Oryza sativa subsp. japonica TaxID=39947 RepID=Q7EY75_ORYSJ|nr:hypothetical protein [Oryza sativa Japonica Group]
MTVWKLVKLKINRNRHWEFRILLLVSADGEERQRRFGQPWVWVTPLAHLATTPSAKRLPVGPSTCCTFVGLNSTWF